MKDQFIKALAEYLVADQVKKSMELQAGKESAQEWAKIRAVSGLHGYPTVEEAEAHLKQFLKK